MRLRALAVGAAGVSLLAGSIAPPAFGAQRGPNSFDGTCHLNGDLAFDQPIGPTLRATSFSDNATGTCSGKLNGVQLDSIPVTNTVTGWGTVSCASGTAHTSDTLVFARKYPIHIYTDSTFLATQGVAHSWGAVSGESVEHVDLLPYTDQSVLEQCNAGQLTSARYQLDARTLSPFVG